LILDDWGLDSLTDAQGRDLLDVIDDRLGRGSVLIASQIPFDHWHGIIKDPTIADALLDRLIHTAHMIAMKGESMRKQLAP
ncbi:MAG: ATP-binding protein, partial [Sulfobacillus sp.]